MIEIDNIYNIDCLEGLKHIPNESIDCVCTDVPYRVTARGGSGTMSGYLTSKMGKRGKVFKHNNINIEDYLTELFRVLKEKSHCYIMCNNSNLPHFMNVINNSTFHFVKNLIWEKGNKICGRYYMSAYEYIFMLRKGGDKPINLCGTSDILKVPQHRDKEQYGKNIHDSQKPTRLMEILIENSTQVGEVVLDPFMGSGTTALAAVNMNRHYIGFEIDKEYYCICQQRIKEAKAQPRLFK